ncbi:dipeptidase [Sphingobium sp. SCG-1]|uniref:dipeptidase n=1 Tax=Sphingobium sp. SCG-1 TaxID=2072936 RepID=UPI001670624B|nr:membrane dipeptidase [Sphingobium sp. SCG-1]
MERHIEGLSKDAYRKMIVIDGKGFLRQRGRYVGKGGVLTDTYLEDVRASGLTAISTTVGGSSAFEVTAAFMSRIDEAIASRPDALMKIETGADIDEAKQSRRLGVIYDTQGTHELDGKVERVAELARLGVRVFQLTYNRAALAGDGCVEGRNAGISDFGREVIEAIEAQHCLLDLSHAGRRTTTEAIAASKRPCAITHAGCNAVTPHPRNVDDAEIRALAEKGGIFGIYFMTYLRASGQSVRDDVIAHIEHAIDIAGEDHVTIGTDGDIDSLVLDKAFREYWRVEVCEPRVRAGIAAPNEGPDIFNYVPEYNVPDRLRLFGDDLIKRGHKLSRVEKILGGNLHRIYRDVFA